MRVTHGWYEKDPEADVFKNLSSVTIELDASERWELLLILNLFLNLQKQKGHETGVKFVKDLYRQVHGDPTNVPYYKEQIAELKQQLRELGKP